MVHLGNIDFNIVDVSVKEEPIDVLNDGQCGNLGQYSGFETFKGLGIVSSDHELVAQLREQGLYPLSCPFEDIGLFPIVGLVVSHGGVQLYVTGSEQVQLPLGG